MVYAPAGLACDRSKWNCASAVAPSLGPDTGIIRPLQDGDVSETRNDRQRTSDTTAAADRRTDVPSMPSAPVASIPASIGGTGDVDFNSRPIGASSVSHAPAGGWAAAEDRTLANNKGRRTTTSM